ncbi:MAG: symmetrical bis(5'-nucleosyl)-tetraphosphatase [Pseudohongiellaceae bacterium]
MATYAIGDIQGCFKALRRLLRQVDFKPGRDRLWCVGDLINRGPKSLDTLRYLRDMDDTCRIVLGNHDLHFLAIFAGKSPARGKDTLAKLLKAPDVFELSEWLRTKPLAHYDCVENENGVGHYLMVHAGVAPQWTLQKTLNCAAEVELALRGPDYKTFLNNMYGDQPSRWDETLTGHDRLRVITNYLTRLRFCDADGNMNLSVKEGLRSAPPGLKPWFEFENITPQASILFGHWAALEGYTGKQQIYALDTGCVWGRELTMMRLEDHRLYSV